jgi:hypothetical protein
VTYHPDPITGTDFPNQFSERTETKSCFLKTVVNGPYSLYELDIPERYVFFVGQQGAQISELIYRVRREDQVIEEDQQYKRTLSAYFSQEGIDQKYGNSINSAGYHLSDIRKLVDRLNEHRTGKTTPKRRSGGITEIDVFAGGALHTFPTVFNGKYGQNDKLPGKLSPIGGLNFLYRFPGRFHSFALGASVGYTQFSSSTDRSGSIYTYNSVNWYYTTKYSEHLSMKRSQVEVNFYGMYFFNPSHTLRPYIKAGIAENYAISSNNDIYDAYQSTTTGISNGVNPINNNDKQTISTLSTKNVYFNINVEAGISTGRHRLELSAAVPQGDIGPERLVPYKVGSYCLCYFFSLLK